MAWNETLTNLNHVLAALYPFTEDSYRIVQTSGIPLNQVAFHRRSLDNWFEILSVADRRGKVLDLVRTARKDYPDNPYLEEAELKGDLRSTIGPILGKELSWNSGQTAGNLEKIMGAYSTLLPVSFLETGLQRARSVARVVLASGEMGSGFLIPGNLFLTNHHVIKSKDTANSAVIQFNYQKTGEGLDLPPVDFHLDPDSLFITSIEDDWTVIRVKDDANGKWGAIEIAQADIKETDRVNIIQHPGGGPKQIALYHNIVAYADDRIIQYLTDSMPGSSGSPVFNSNWQLVALHHSGGWILEPESKKPVFRNEGININRIVTGLKQAGLA